MGAVGGDSLWLDLYLDADSCASGDPGSLAEGGRVGSNVLEGLKVVRLIRRPRIVASWLTTQVGWP